MMGKSTVCAQNYFKILVGLLIIVNFFELNQPDSSANEMTDLPIPCKQLLDNPLARLDHSQPFAASVQQYTAMSHSSNLPTNRTFR